MSVLHISKLVLALSSKHHHQVMGWVVDLLDLFVLCLNPTVLSNWKPTETVSSCDFQVFNSYRSEATLNQTLLGFKSGRWFWLVIKYSLICELLIAVDNSGVQGKVETKSSGYGSLLRCSISFKAFSFYPDNVNPLCFGGDFTHTPLFIIFISSYFARYINKIDLTLLIIIIIIIMLSNQLHMHMNAV